MGKFKKSQPLVLRAARPVGESELLGLPAIEDPDGLDRVVRWVRIMRGPILYYHGWEIEISKEYLDLLVANSIKAAGPDYRPPLLRVHEDVGEREGEIFSYAVIEEPDQPDGVWSCFVAVVFFDEPETVLEKIESGKWSSVSVGIWETQSSVDGIYRESINEVSLVAMPHINEARILNSKGEPSMDPKELAAALVAALMEAGMVPSKEEEVEAAEESDSDAEDAEVEEEVIAECDEPEALAAAKRRVAELEAQILAGKEADARSESRKAFDKAYPDGMVIELSAANRDALFQLALSNKAQFDAFINATEPVELKQQAQVETDVIEIPNQWGEIVASGSVGNPTDKAPKSVEEITAGIKAAGGLKNYINAQYGKTIL